MNTPQKASIPVIKRLPKYYRYLRSLQADGITSISSRELASQMGTTASQVRQDFNCIGDVNGRQGIGYSVENLLSILESLLFGNGDRLPTILIGCGRLGKARRSAVSASGTLTSWRPFARKTSPRWRCSVYPVMVHSRSADGWWIWASRASGTSPTMTCRCRTPMWWWKTSIWATA